MKALSAIWYNWQLATFGLLLVLGALLPGTARASHIRAGNIEAKVDTTAAHNPNRIFFKLIIYQDLSPASADQPTATLYFGDGTSQTVNRVSGTGNKQVIPIAGSPDTGLDVFYFDHTYPAAGKFTASFIGENRNQGILNFIGTQSNTQSFYVSTALTIDPALGLNRSPILRTPAVDKAGQNQVYLHNPGAYDADGDSMVFKLRPSQQAPSTPTNNRPVPAVIAGFVYPDKTPGNANARQVPYNGVPASNGSGAAIFQQDSRTGQITWNAPLQTGFYNVAFEVQEWRRIDGFPAQQIGTVIQDIQIIVIPTNNLRPILTIPPDLCVIAGTTVTGTVTATDGSAAGSAAPTPVTLNAYSGILPPAVFTQSAKGPPTATGRFTWATDCSNVAKEPYSVVFRAQDSPPSPDFPLVDEQVWRITVVGPPPQNLRAVPAGNQVTLTWDRYICSNASFIRIYRKENSSNFVPGPCDTGIPASAGYTLVGSVTADLSAFKDDNAGRGLDRGKTYCYRIYADFPLPALGASIASAEACATVGGSSARLKNVDVDQTSATGQITVRWSPAKLATTQLLNTPSGYRLSRAVGLSPAATAYTVVRATPFSLTDSVFVDTNVNTAANQYTYKLDLFYASAAGSTTEIVEPAGTASSVRTALVPDSPNKQITVNWTYQTPWDNTKKPTLVFRSGTAGGPFAQVGSVTSTTAGGTFVDKDPALVKGNTYCYYVQTNGQYNPTGYLSELLNKSQIICTTLTDQPCVPVLSLALVNCDSLARNPPSDNQTYANSLRWTASAVPTGCSAPIAYYRVFYRPTVDGALALLDSTNTMSYVHRNLPELGGCYAVQAVSTGGLRSALSNVVCQNNCPFFILPNIFTPNGDGVNEIFQPKSASPLRSVHFKAFNRWGAKVFESTTTSRIFINWDGGGAVGESGSSGKVSDGLYYYLAEVEFADAANTKITYKGWVQIVR
ncbi:gliding motility-associated C-terminal domain-containing protein [Hymenobacter nivis]|nr:gliding motility-associated C-terminal domain-containing protein [Hymenobacter nivis]